MQPPLQPLHADETLIPLKLEQFRKVTTEDLIKSLAPGRSGALKVRPDGTMLDGHHRIKVLRDAKHRCRRFAARIMPRA